MLDVCKFHNENVGIVYEEKAFNRLNHTYLFSARRAFGLGEGFLATTTNSYRAHLDPHIGQDCYFCCQAETLERLFVPCPRLSALFELLKRCLQGLREDFSFIFINFGAKILHRKEGCPHTGERFVWFCQVGHLAVTEES